MPDISPFPAPDSPLLAVDRAIAELRRQRPVLLTGTRAQAVVLAAEGVDDAALAGLAGLGGQRLGIAITGRRALLLGAACDPAQPFLVDPPAGADAAFIAGLIDPERPRAATRLEGRPASFGGLVGAAVRLAKLARLYPAAALAIADPAFATDAPAVVLPRVDTEAVLGFQEDSARSLTRVSEARVPLADAPQARVIAFRPQDGGIEHLAIVVGDPDPGRPVLVRLHSECFTGDLLGSLRCDCGDQLRGALAAIGAEGQGILLYLAQEGRGIGLVNKLRAYRLQDGGLDTVDANEQLGFDDDERVYLPAVEMLRHLGISRVRLLTNNPAKVEALVRHGVSIVERVGHAFPDNEHNRAYLHTKARRSGHLL